MENQNRSQEIREMLKTMEIQYCPVPQRNEVRLEEYTRVPISEIAALGALFQPLSHIFQQVVLGQEGGGNGLYWVTGVANGQCLASARDGSGFLGAILKEGGGLGQARLHPFACDPATLCMAIALMSINRKLDKIQKTQREILAFLELKEKTALKGNLNTLADILKNYQYNWNNEMYKINKHIQVQEIMRDAEQSIIFYQERIKKEADRRERVHTYHSVKEKLEKVKSEFQDYNLAVYLYAFSAFLEVMLLENFEEGYLDSMARKIEDYDHHYASLYAKCFKQIEKSVESSAEMQVLHGLAEVDKFAGKAMVMLPLAGKGKINGRIAGKIEKTVSKKAKEVVNRYKGEQENGTRIFAKNIKMINKIYNQPLNLLFDKEHIYFSVIA